MKRRKIQRLSKDLLLILLDLLHVEPLAGRVLPPRFPHVFARLPERWLRVQPLLFLPQRPYLLVERRFPAKQSSASLLQRDQARRLTSLVRLDERLRHLVLSHQLGSILEQVVA